MYSWLRTTSGGELLRLMAKGHPSIKVQLRKISYFLLSKDLNKSLMGKKSEFNTDFVALEIIRFSIKCEKAEWEGFLPYSSSTLLRSRRWSPRERRRASSRTIRRPDDPRHGALPSEEQKSGKGDFLLFLDRRISHVIERWRWVGRSRFLGPQRKNALSRFRRITELLLRWNKANTLYRSRYNY